MKTSYLFPNRFKKIGLILLISGILLGILWLINQSGLNLFNVKVFALVKSEILKETKFLLVTETNILDELSTILIIIGALFVAFSKEKTEDEFISKIRLESLVWATYVNYTILLLSIIFVFGLAFLWVFVFNMFTLLIFFIIRFNWVLYKFKNQMRDEE